MRSYSRGVDLRRSDGHCDEGPDAGPPRYRLVARPRWYDRACGPAVYTGFSSQFREQFSTHMPSLSDQTRVVLDILPMATTTSRDFSRPFVHHYRRFSSGRSSRTRSAVSSKSRDSLLAFPPGTLMNRSRRLVGRAGVVGKVQHNPRNPSSTQALRMRPRRAPVKPVKFRTAHKGPAIFLDSHTRVPNDTRSSSSGIVSPR